MFGTSCTVSRVGASSFAGSAVAPRRPARAAARRAPLAPRADVGKYLSEAASQIFHPQQESDVDWTGTSTPFAGSIQHHEGLRALHDVVKTARKEVEEALSSADESDAAAAAETTYKFDEAGNLVGQSGLQEYLSAAISRIFGHQFKGDTSEPATFMSTGYSYSGRLRSKRDIQREFDRLKKFESVVVEAIEKTAQE